MPRPKNEWKICDAVIRVLERRVNAVRENVRSPERDRIGPPVEYRFDLDGMHYALEHTYIEPFEDEVRTGAHFNDFVRPIVVELQDTMPRPGFYQVTFPLNPSAGLRHQERMTVQRKVVDWIRNAGQRLYDEKPKLEEHDRHAHENCVREAPDDVPFELVLSRKIFPGMRERVNGRLVVARFAPQDYEALRIRRIRRAFDMKCPKLSRCRDEGAYTVLALESSDVSLTNHFVVGDVVEILIAERDDAPDEIFYVDVSIEDRWTVWSLCRDGVMWPDEDAPSRYEEFSPSDLRDL